MSSISTFFESLLPKSSPWWTARVRTMLIGPTNRDSHPLTPTLIDFFKQTIRNDTFEDAEVYSSLDTLVTKQYPFKLFDVVCIIEHQGELWKLQDSGEFQRELFLCLIYNALNYVKEDGFLFVSRCYADAARQALLDEFPKSYESKVGIIDFCIIPKTL